MAVHRSEVLVVEDDEDVCAVVRMTREYDGFRVRTAPHGGAAAELLGEAPPAVVVLDLVMPVMDGWEFRRRQQRSATWRAVPVVVITAEEDMVASASAIAPAAVFVKPFDVGELSTTVGRLVRGAVRGA